MFENTRRKLRSFVAAIRSRGLALLNGVPREEYKHLADANLVLIGELRSTQRALQRLERIMGSEIGKRVVERIGHNMSGEVRRQIVKAVRRACDDAGAMGGVPTSVVIEVSSEELRWLDPDSLEHRVLEEWRVQTAPNLRAFVDADTPMHMDATILDVRVPELGYREVVRH